MTVSECRCTANAADTQTQIDIFLQKGREAMLPDFFAYIKRESTAPAFHCPSNFLNFLNASHKMQQRLSPLKTFE